MLYRCFRTRREVLAASAGAPHVGDPADLRAFTAAPISPEEEAERLARGEAFAWRLSLHRAAGLLGGLDRLTWREEGEDAGLRQAAPERLGDVVLGRKDIGAGYVIASVVDDAAQGVTQVIRGVDLAEVTSVQRVLQALLELPTPAYRHHPLLLGSDGRRLAKRDRAETLAAIRERGVSAEQVRADLGFG